MVQRYQETKPRLFSKYFPVPQYLTLNPVGIDISSKSVRIVKLRKTNDGFIPLLYDEVKFENACNLLEDEKDLNHCDELRDALKILKKKYNFEFAAISLPEMKTYIFKTKIPKEAISTINETIKFRLEENVPLDPHDVVFDYEIPDNGAEVHDNHIDVVVTVLPKGVIRTYTALFKQVGITPISFESESHSIARAVVSEEDKNPYLIINLDGGKVNISVVEENVVHYTSSVPVDSKNVVADFNGQEAQILKEQINKLLVYWFTNKQDVYDQERIENAILTGEGALSPGLVDFLEKHLKLSVQVANVWQNCFSLDKYIPTISHAKSLDYAVSIGSALMYT